MSLPSLLSDKAHFIIFSEEIILLKISSGDRYGGTLAAGKWDQEDHFKASLGICYLSLSKENKTKTNKNLLPCQKIHLVKFLVC